MEDNHKLREEKKKILVEPYRVANLCQKNKKLSIAFGGTFQNTEPKHGFFRAFLFCNINTKIRNNNIAKIRIIFLTFILCTELILRAN